MFLKLSCCLISKRVGWGRTSRQFYFYRREDANSTEVVNRTGELQRSWYRRHQKGAATLASRKFYHLRSYTLLVGSTYVETMENSTSLKFPCLWQSCRELDVYWNVNSRILQWGRNSEGRYNVSRFSSTFQFFFSSNVSNSVTRRIQNKLFLTRFEQLQFSSFWKFQSRDREMSFDIDSKPLNLEATKSKLSLLFLK